MAAVRYVESREFYTVSYVRHSRAIGVLWGVFAVCYAIISVVVFVQPQWVGDTSAAPGSGYFGLWRHCAHSGALQVDRALTCSGRLSDLSTNISPAFRAATVFVGLTMVTALLSVICFTMFFFLRANTVFRLCAWMQLVSGVCLLVAVLVFPAGWDAARLREVCGPAADKYRPAGCAVRWAFVLAVIGALDALVLAALGMALAAHRVRPPPEPEPAGSLAPATARAGLLGEAASLASSHRSLHLQPVMLMPQREPDRCSEFSHRSAGRPGSRHSEPRNGRPVFGPGYDFQL